jgi:hypothetical protein
MNNLPVPHRPKLEKRRAERIRGVYHLTAEAAKRIGGFYVWRKNFGICLTSPKYRSAGQSAGAGQKKVRRGAS